MGEACLANGRKTVVAHVSGSWGVLDEPGVYATFLSRKPQFRRKEGQMADKV